MALGVAPALAPSPGLLLPQGCSFPGDGDGHRGERERECALQHVVLHLWQLGPGCGPWMVCLRGACAGWEGAGIVTVVHAVFHPHLSPALTPVAQLDHSGRGLRAAAGRQG